MMADEKRYYFRLNYFHRIMHAFVMVSFLGLALTGLPLKYSDAHWASWLAYFLGGFQAAGYFHRVFAVVTLGYFAAHMIFLVWFFGWKSKEPFFRFLFGPGSMVPRWKDLWDLLGNFRWFVGLGPRPKYDRFTYWEKFDYWAVFWGVGIIGVSGLMLWFPTFFTRFLPGWALNVATIVHSDEALLAVGFIFIFHYIHTHLRGDKFPLDQVIFTGRLSEEEMKHDKPLEYERLVGQGRLDEIRADPPPLWLHNFARIVGFSALALGIFIIILVIAAGF
jgi:cytochrome b subunit of formate dehydrogenase